MKKIVIPIVILSLAIGGGVGYYFGYDHGWERSVIEEQQVNSQQVGENSIAFQEDDRLGFYGTLTLTGYIEIQRRVCNPGDMCGQTVDYASFVFTETTSDAIREFIGEHQGNLFATNNKIGLGCYYKNPDRIHYVNFGDESSDKGIIAGADAAKLLASDVNNQVRLRLTRPIYTSGQGAPDCYSHFRSFDVL